jgi:hypothetical protein
MTMLANPKPPEPANHTDQIKQEVAHHLIRPLTASPCQHRSSLIAL